MRPPRWPAVLALSAAAMAAQWSLQQPLARANEVRGSRRLHAAPSSLAFRMAAGGVKEAAGDALWLSVLPKLGRPWAEPARKAAWIESVATVMADANPRAHFPITYAAYFLEFIERRHPGIERLLRHGMDVEKRGAFGTVTRPNAGDWELPMALGMNIVLYGKPAERERGLEWLRTAATKPDCPTILIDYVAALRAKEGNPLEAWTIWGVRAGMRESREWQEICLREADRARLDVLRRWAEAAEERADRWPETVGEVLEAAPAAVREFLDRFPDKKAALVDGVRLIPETRDIRIPALAERMVAGGREEIRQTALAWRAAHGSLPADLRALELALGRQFPPPPFHGTRWALDPGTGEPSVVIDAVDPRVGRPLTPLVRPR